MQLRVYAAIEKRRLPRLASRFSLILSAWAVGCTSTPNVPPPAIVIAATTDTIVGAYNLASAAVSRSDGTWIVLAPEEGVVLVADFAAKSLTAHAGITKANVPGPSVLIGVGDTVVIGDWGQQRFTTWLASGDQIAAVPVPTALAGAFPHARDAAGQWYFEIGPPPGQDGAGLRDSSAVVRSDAALTRFDTVARLAPVDLAEVVTNEGSRLTRRAMGGRDRWGVERDGALWVARVDQNFFEWYPPGDGKKTKGPRLPDPVLTVQDMDRQIFVRRFPEDYRASALQVPFAAIKPPFEAVLTAGPGMWLLEKNGVALDSTRTFQVVDREGVLRRVTVPSRGNALGFSGTHLLMTEQFPGGVRLLRYAVPAAVVAGRVED